MNLIKKIFLFFKREAKLFYSNIADLFSNILFFFLSIFIFVFALGTDEQLLRTIGLGIIWSLLLLSSTLSLRKFYEEDFSKFYADNILQKVWNIGHDIGYGEFFVFERGAQFLDDHYYVNNITSIPTIDIIEFDPSSKNKFNKHWHTHGDDLNNISKQTLKAVGQTVMHVIYND